jgi:xanthine dehydrogenase accessory factor
MMFEEIYAHIRKNREMVLATVVEALGSSPGRQAFKMIVFSDGKTKGTVGGGAVEHTVIQRARKCFEEGKSHLESFDLESLGMACGGKMTVFFEYIPRHKQLFIFGGGHICQAVTPMAAALEFDITIVDNREDVARADLHPCAKNVLYGDYGAIIRELEISAPSFALIVSHKHLHDEEILRGLLLREDNFTYLGMIGSRKKVRNCIDRLISEGIKKEKADNVFSPVGIDIGADTPHEIAVSILAEMIAIEKGKTVPHMKLRSRAAND